MQTKTISALSALSNTDRHLELVTGMMFVAHTDSMSFMTEGQRVLHSYLNAYKQCWLSFSCSGCRLSGAVYLSKCLFTSFTLEGSVSVKGVEMRGSVIEAHAWLVTEVLRIFLPVLFLCSLCWEKLCLKWIQRCQTLTFSEKTFKNVI